MKLFYMNQGVNGGWGPVPYAQFDVICLAESDHPVPGFTMDYSSRGNSLPIMSVQVADGARRVVGLTDLDAAYLTVRPLLMFQAKGRSVYVVFLHLKSGSAKLATNALQIAVEAVKARFAFVEMPPILWIGDFNRANPSPLADGLGTVNKIFAGGGNAAWDLDRVYATGPWKTLPTCAVATTSVMDHNHVGLTVDF